MGKKNSNKKEPLTKLNDADGLKARKTGVSQFHEIRFKDPTTVEEFKVIINELEESNSYSQIAEYRRDYRTRAKQSFSIRIEDAVSLVHGALTKDAELQEEDVDHEGNKVQYYKKIKSKGIVFRITIKPEKKVDIRRIEEDVIYDDFYSFAPTKKGLVEINIVNNIRTPFAMEIISFNSIMAKKTFKYKWKVINEKTFESLQSWIDNQNNEK